MQRGVINAIYGWVVVLLLAVFLAASPALANDALFLYCGAGLRQPVDELIKGFEKETGVRVQVEFSGSGQALTRYKATGKGDVFLPGSHFYIDKLKAAGKVTWSRPVVLHLPVVAFRKDSLKRPSAFTDLAKPGVRVGLGDPKAMALGRTAVGILKSSGIGAQVEKNVVVRAATVKQLTMYVLKGDVDAAIIARADVFQNRDKLDMLEIDARWYRPEIVTVATLETSRQAALARRLAEYLSSPKAVETFGRFGFLPAR